MQSMNANQIGMIFKARIKEIVERLHPHAKKGVLYGSQTIRPSLSSDIDLMLITNTNQANEIFLIVAELQIKYSQIIHAIIISDNDVETNPYFRKFIREGLILWDFENTVRDNL